LITTYGEVKMYAAYWCIYYKMTPFASSVSQQQFRTQSVI